ncbi:protein FAM110C [Trichechus manatus latirostris]|uniref:Protein FAM110C n=1 Tax=Trichechus manatus latirostris TaxID=127582 RepID=A0A2Y9DEG8_TRIMA|nr:protein FAM110C [Trichechus manatus latirostris]
MDNFRERQHQTSLLCDCDGPRQEQEHATITSEPRRNMDIVQAKKYPPPLLPALAFSVTSPNRPQSSSSAKLTFLDEAIWRGRPGGRRQGERRGAAGGAQRALAARRQLVRTSEFTQVGTRDGGARRARGGTRQSEPIWSSPRGAPEARSQCPSAWTRGTRSTAAMPAGVAPRVSSHALPAFDAPLSERLLHRGPDYLRRHLDATRPARRSAVERLAADRAKYVKSRPVAGRGTEETAPGAPQPPARAPCPVARRAIARKPLRPDSLVIYRQKCEFVKGQGADGSRASLVRKLFQGPGKDKALASAQGQEPRAQGQEAPSTKAAGSSLGPGPVAGSVPPTPPAPSTPAGAPSRCQAMDPGPDLREVRRRGLHRSQSDISSRYSKSFAEFDTFFQYCGLDPEVVEDLGRENFSAGSDHIAFKVRSVSIATSDSGFSRHSGGDDGLQEDELMEQVPSRTSVIEKNARIIKWLYTCKAAKQTPTQQGAAGAGVTPPAPEPGNRNPEVGFPRAEKGVCLCECLCLLSVAELGDG